MQKPLILVNLMWCLQSDSLWAAMAEDAFEELDLHQSDEESKNPDHSKLLGAVSQLYEKKRYTLKLNSLF